MRNCCRVANMEGVQLSSIARGWSGQGPDKGIHMGLRGIKLWGTVQYVGATVDQLGESGSQIWS